MITLALMAVLSSEPQPVLAQWEACAASAASTCTAPDGTFKWKACLEAASAQVDFDEWDMCEVASFPECFSDQKPDDVQAELRLCGAQRVVASRAIATAWTDEVTKHGGQDFSDRMEAVTTVIEQRAKEDIPADPLSASGARVGTWAAGLKALALVRRLSMLK